MNDSQHKEYWASVDGTEIAMNILDKVDNFYNYLLASGRLDLYRRSWSYYYRPLLNGAMLNPAGEQGELTTITTGNYRNLLSHLEVMTTQQKASFEPIAANSDVKSQSQVILCASLLDYYMKQKRLERNFKQSVKDALIFGEGFIRVEWDVTGGKPYGKTATGATVYEGDLKYTNYAPTNVIRDYTKQSPSQEDWYILRDFQNKYTLAAKYPELADDILSDSIDMLELAKSTSLNAMGLEESDNITVYTLLHKPTPALPQGRLVTVLDNRTIMLDGPMPYKEGTHVYRIAPDEITGSIFGYTVGFDLLSPCEAADAIYSVVCTNQLTFGVQNILVPKGNDLSTSQLSGGLNVTEYDPKVGKPEGLNLTKTPAEIFSFIGMLEKLSETISGVNSVARGNPESSLKSGAALALVQSMAIQFSMGLQQSYAQIVEDIGTGSINILQTFAATPRVAAIAGKSNRALLKEFTGQDLSEIQRVTVDMGNPMTKTLSGKVSMADAYLEKGFIDNPDQYVQVVTTGRLEPIIEGKQANLLLMKGENEGLSAGIPQRALITDNHPKHILEHTTVLANADIRQDPNNPIVVVTLKHIQEHMDMMNNPANMQLLQILHQEVIPQAMPQPTQGGGTGNMLNATPPVVQEAENVQMPGMPAPPQGTDAQSAEVIQQNQ